MGFIEETGAAQHLRDARITTIYEGTTGIQAMDLGRPQDRAATAASPPRRWLGSAEDVRRRTVCLNADRPGVRSLSAGAQAVADCVDFIVAASKDPTRGLSPARVPFLKLMGIVAGGWQMARAASDRREEAAARGWRRKSFYAGEDRHRALLRRARARRRRRACATPSSRARAGSMALSDEQFLAA
mgnify:CR=1 FL=1